MRMIVYAAEEKQRKKIIRVVQLFFSEEDIDCHASIESLQKGLRRKCRADEIAVLMASNQRELHCVKLIAGMLEDMKIILVLPDRSRETVSLGHALYPRYISYADGDLDDVRAVLGKMIQQAQAKRPTNPLSEVNYGQN